MKTDLIKLNQHYLEKIELHQELLSKADNNLKYIKSLRYLKKYLELFSNNAHNALSVPDAFSIIPINNAEYLAMFTGCGVSFYDSISNSILEYEYGVRPF